MNEEPGVKEVADREISELQQTAGDVYATVAREQRQVIKQADLNAPAARLERSPRRDDAFLNRLRTPRLARSALSWRPTAGWKGAINPGRLASTMVGGVGRATATWRAERHRLSQESLNQAEASLTAPYWFAAFRRLIEDFQIRFGREPSILDWHSGLEFKAVFPNDTFFLPPTAPDDRFLPYLDGSIDIVVVPFPDRAALAEACRVASAAVVTFGREDEENLYPTPFIEGLSSDSPEELRSISIVIPSYNGPDLTAACIANLQETIPDDIHVEIIVVDDCSTEKTWSRLNRLASHDHRIKPIRNQDNLGFIETCNRGAAAAEGDILIFLNQDTVPLPGWLQPLVQTFRAYPDAGAVGGKLVYPDGRLQEAGAIIFRDGFGANFGRGDDPDDPLYNYVREVDYCSGALLATPRSLFVKIGGFDRRYRPAYYEDTDYCFRVRTHGCRVYYQPESMIIHHEGSVSGTDRLAGTKRYQAINRLKFVAKWEEDLMRQPASPDRYDRATWHALAVRGDPASSPRA